MQYDFKRVGRDVHGNKYQLMVRVNQAWLTIGPEWSYGDEEQRTEMHKLAHTILRMKEPDYVGADYYAFNPLRWADMYERAV